MLFSSPWQKDMPGIFSSEQKAAGQAGSFFVFRLENRLVEGRPLYPPGP
jgi:hypothetical protein